MKAVYNFLNISVYVQLASGQATEWVPNCRAWTHSMSDTAVTKLLMQTEV